MALIFDIETDGFLENVTKIHCLVIKDTETGEVHKYFNMNVIDGVNHLMYGASLQLHQDIIVGHNIIKYDLPVIQKLYPWFTYDPSKVFDTLVCTRLIWNNIGDTDGARIEQGKLPSNLSGSQSLEAWGYRLGKMKGEYAKDFKDKAGKDYQPGDEWKTFNEDMLSYCVTDVEVTEELYRKILDKNYSQQALDLEHQVAFICAKMERTGFPFDVPKAASLYAELAQKRDAILKQMQDTFEPEVIKRVSEKTGKPLKDKVIEFNPGSRKQIADRLIRKYQWKPKEFTPSGQPKIDETVLGGLEYPEAKVLAEFFMLEKRVGQLAEGDNAWLKLERNGKLHGGYNPNGAVTGRCTHQTPNMAQVPAVRSPYGGECRDLFTVRPGFTLVGSDLSGIELRCLAHFMHKYDGGTYGTTVVSGKQADGTDVHSVNTRAFGFEWRDSGKTGVYATLYGAAGLKIFQIAEEDARRSGKTLLTIYDTEKKQKAYGNKILNRFFDNTPALKHLKDAVSKAAERGYIKGLDGRHVHIRSAHAALNSLLQCAGALISKQWLVEVIKAAEAKGWQWKEDWSGDYAFCAWVHDECQIGVRDEIADEFGKLVVEAAAKAGEHFGFKVPVGAEYCLGKTWKDTH